MSIRQLITSLIVLISFSEGSFGQSTLPSFRFVNQNEVGLLLHPVYLYSGGDTFPTASQLMDDSKFTLLPPQVPNLSVTNAPVYLRFRIENLSMQRELAIQCSNPILDHILLMEIAADGLDTIDVQGEIQPFSSRFNGSPNFIFPVDIDINHAKEFILEVSSGEQLLLPLEIGITTVLAERQHNKDLIFALYSGIVLVMLIYNLFIFFSVKDKSYLYYVINMLFVGLLQLTLNGYSDKYFWCNWDWMRLSDTYLIGALSGITTVVFAQNFLNIKKHVPKLNIVLNIYIGLYVVALILAAGGYYNISYNLINFNGAASFLLLFAAYRGVKRGFRPARFYLIAWTIFLAGVTLFVLKDFGVLPYNNFTLYALPLGSALEIILISFALADRINILKLEKEESQMRALKVLRQNEQMIKEQNVMLEAKVEERTHELRRSNIELKEAVQNLKDTQIQLVESEKMASLGQLTAGVAHELNNPINFVSGNVQPLKRDVEELLELVEMYERRISGNDTSISDEEFEAKKAEIDLELLKLEIPKLLDGISIGASRTSEIVKGLRMFSRLDEQDLKVVSIVECLESSLIILKGELRSKATVIKDYQHLDPINCYPGKINQVFVNLISNALFAIRKAGKTAEDGILTVKAHQTAKHVIVSIKDNGVGMDEHTRMRIFEPFFTTKSVGDGTGLGMAIVLGIVNDHKGRIEVESSLGYGTEIILTLPRDLS